MGNPHAASLSHQVSGLAEWDDVVRAHESDRSFGFECL